MFGITHTQQHSSFYDFARNVYHAFSAKVRIYFYFIPICNI